MLKLPLAVTVCRAALILTSVLTSACADKDAESVDAATDPAEAVCALNWDVKNVVPCVAAPNLSTPPLIYSSHLGADGQPQCEPYLGFPQPVPEKPWSEQTLTAVSTGAARLCIAMKHGKAKAPSEDDCVLFEHCLDATYDVAGEVQALPPLPAWAASDEVCSRIYYTEGGYIELRASSDALGCSEGGEQIKRIQMCPLDCPPSGDEREKCANCALKTSITGEF